MKIFGLLLISLLMLSMVSAAEGSSGQSVKILKVGGVSANSDVNLTAQQGANGTTVFKAHLSNGMESNVKIMPNRASETAIARLKLNVCSEENNCTIVLKEVGMGSNTKAAYEIKATKKMKILGLFKANANVAAYVDAETGEIISVKKPWWVFISTEVKSSA